MPEQPEWEPPDSPSGASAPEWEPPGGVDIPAPTATPETDKALTETSALHIKEPPMPWWQRAVEWAKSDVSGDLSRAKAGVAKAFPMPRLATPTEMAQRLGGPQDLQTAWKAVNMPLAPRQLDPAYWLAKGVEKGVGVPPSSGYRTVLQAEAGALKGATSFGEGLSTPVNIGALFLPESRLTKPLLTTAYLTFAAHATPDMLRQYHSAQSPAEKARIMTEGLGMWAMAGIPAAKQALSGLGLGTAFLEGLMARREAAQRAARPEFRFTTPEGKVGPEPGAPPEAAAPESEAAAAETPTAAAPAAPAPPETDEQAQARAGGLMVKYRQLGGEPDALHRDMTEDQGQPPTWKEYADELDQEIKDLTSTPEKALKSYTEGMAKARGITVKQLEEGWTKQQEIARERFLEELKDTELSRKELEEEKPKGGRYAKQPSYAQVETGETPLRVETRAGREVPRTGDRYKVERGAEGEAPGREIPQEPRPARPPVAPKTPEPAHEPESLELRNRAIENIRKELQLPKDPVELFKLQQDELAPTSEELQKLQDFEYQKLLRQRQREIQAAATAPVAAAIRKGAKESVEGGVPPTEEEDRVPRVPAPPLGRMVPEEPVEPGARRKAYQRIAPGRYEHKDTGLIVHHNTQSGGWDIRHPTTGEVLDNLPTRRQAIDAYLDGRIPEKRAPRPEPAAPKEPGTVRSGPQPHPMDQSRMQSTVDQAYASLYTNHKISGASPAFGLTRSEMIAGGREAIRNGVDPEQVRNSEHMRPDLKYGILRAEGENLYDHADILDKIAQAKPTEANKAAAEKAFEEYSNWDQDVVEPERLKADAWLKGASHEDLEPEGDIRSFTEFRQKFIKELKTDMTDKQKAQARSLIKNIEKANQERAQQLEAKSEYLRKAAPNPEHGEITNPDELNDIVSKIWNKHFPCK